MKDIDPRSDPSRLIWAALFAAIALALLVGGYWFYRAEAREIRRNKSETLSAIGQLKTAQVVQWRKQRLADVERLVKSPLFGKALAKYLVDPDTPGLREDLSERLNIDQRAYGHGDLFLFDLRENILFSTERNPDPLGPVTRQIVARSLTSGKPLFSDFFLDPRGNIQLDAVAPVVGADGRPLAVAVLRNHARDFLYPLIQTWPTPSNSSETLLVRRDGDDVLFLNNLRHQDNAALTLRIPLTRTDLPAVQAVLGKQGVFEGRDYRGIKVLADLRPVPGSPWFLVAKMDKTEILADARYRAGVIAVVVLLFIMLVGAVTAFGYRKRQAGIYRKLYQSERGNREGQEQFRATLDNMLEGCQIIGFDWRYLYLNQAAERHGRRPREELLGRTQMECYPGIEQTEMFVLEKRCLEERSIHYLENEFVYPDGSRGWFMLIIQPAPEGIVIFSEDITERKRSETALSASEVRYRGLFESAKDGILILDAGTGAVVDVNPFLVELLGIPAERILGEKIWELGIFTDVIASRDYFEELLRQRYVRYDDLPLKTVEGRPIEVEFISNVYMVGRHQVVQVNIRNITERKRAEDRERLAHEALNLLNRSESNQDTVRDLLHLIQKSTGLEAVGIRLREGDDFPYVCQNGFSREFVSAENSLAALNPDGSFCRDQNGRLSLECTCGMIISGKTDRSNPCVTRGGSCWTNPAAQSPDLPAPKDHRLNPRNRCLHEGYQSVALIPLRLGEEIIGLLQLNDRRPNLFTLDQIEFFEGLGASISIALSGKQAERALRESEERYRIITENMGDTVWLMDNNLKTIYISPSVFRARGFTLDEIRAMPMEKNFTPASMEAVTRVLAEELTPERLAQPDRKIERTLELEFARKDGSFFWSEATITLIRDRDGKPAGYVGVGRDITERKRAEADREKLESQFRQSQKMEAIGLLAGGVAHDFNNQLTVILTSAGMAMKDADPQGQLFEDLTDIYNAAQRSANLTRQLLSFARKEMISPQVLDLNDAIGELLKMLGRLIGEGIRLTWKPSTDPGLVKIDPSQLDQLLANLAVNARDAIGGHGNLIIETENVVFDADYCEIYPDCAPGPHVMLAVSDDGSGMDPETQARMFEPFFTTKERGQGTGLGLATVYGIVRQNGGIINVYSEPGKGTTFKIYLPQAPAPAGVVAPVKGKLLMGNETILLVEDEEPILKIAVKITRKCGYQVLSTRSPRQAIELAREHHGPIHLLLTDVVMPEMNGKELAGRVLALRPGSKTLYMSGYSADIIAHNGVIEEGAVFLQKPFSQEALAAKIRQALSQS